MSAAFFDLDKTVIAKSSTLAFGKPFYRGGLVNRRAVLKSSFAQFLYLLQGADEETMDRLRDYLAALCAGWPVQQVQELGERALQDGAAVDQPALVERLAERQGAALRDHGLVEVEEGGAHSF